MSRLLSFHAGVDMALNRHRTMTTNTGVVTTYKRKAEQVEAKRLNARIRGREGGKGEKGRREGEGGGKEGEGGKREARGGGRDETGNKKRARQTLGQIGEIREMIWLTYGKNNTKNMTA